MADTKTMWWSVRGVIGELTTFDAGERKWAIVADRGAPSEIRNGIYHEDDIPSPVYVDKANAIFAADAYVTVEMQRLNMLQDGIQEHIRAGGLQGANIWERGFTASDILVIRRLFAGARLVQHADTRPFLYYDGHEQFIHDEFHRLNLASIIRVDWDASALEPEGRTVWVLNHHLI